MAGNHLLHQHYGSRLQTFPHLPTILANNHMPLPVGLFSSLYSKAMSSIRIVLLKI